MANYPYYQPYNNVYGNPCQTMQQSQQIQPVQQPQQTQNGFNCRPVTCREEAVAAQVDFMSAGLIMPISPKRGLKILTPYPIKQQCIMSTS